MPASPSATLTVESTGVVVRARGDFDFASCQALAAALDEATGAGLPVLVDVTRVSFMDAACLGEIARTRERLATAGRELRVVGAQGVVRRIFELTDLAAVLSD